MEYVGYIPYIDAVRAVLKDHLKRDPLQPVRIEQLDYDVGYRPEIEDLKEETSKHGWYLYRSNIRLALLALAARGEVRAREHCAFDFEGAPREANDFSVHVQPDAFEGSYGFINAAVKGLGEWSNEPVDLATTEVRGKFSEADVFKAIRSKMSKPPKWMLGNVVYSTFVRMRVAPARTPMRQVQSGSVVALYGRTDLIERRSAPLFCLYDLEPAGSISGPLVEKARSLSLEAKSAHTVLASNKMVATRKALLSASCGVPPVTLMGFGEVVATSDLIETANDFDLARLFGVI